MRRWRSGWVCAALLAAAGCGGGDALQDAPVPAPTELPAAEPAPEPAALAGVVAAPVHGRSGPGGVGFEVTSRSDPEPQHLERRIGLRPFEIAMRATGMTQYPCGSCHLPGGRIVEGERTPDAHADIVAAHPLEVGAICTACHTPADVERLVLPGGETAPLDAAYRLCATCHFTQVEDWAGGAHGKRLDGWRGRRVVMGCADCHDPHDPGLEMRVPFRGPTLPRRGRQP